ncbi:MAG: GNAT family N-acetyltransferase [Eubacteriales bacterium]|nr:GNAT family N-acetyltransferase [Eubacteriales bacterium]
MEEKKITIRRAVASDLDGVNYLLRQVLMVHHNGRPDLFKANVKKYTDEELLEIFKDDKRPIFVGVDENNQVMGYAFCVYQQELNHNVLTDVKTLYIDDICVDENARGMHVGKQIYEYVIDFAKKNDFYNVTLNVWNCNPPAMKFYESMGFVPYKVGMEVVL